MVIDKRSVCSHDCPDTCEFLVGVENERVVSVKMGINHLTSQKVMDMGKVGLSTAIWLKRRPKNNL